MFGIPGLYVLQANSNVSCSTELFFAFSVSAGRMNSLPGKAALSLCRRAAAGGMRVLVAPPGRPTGGAAQADRAALQAVRVCHSGTNQKGSVYTKKRGYDITRNPHLNKVSLFICRCEPLYFIWHI